MVLLDCLFECFGFVCDFPGDVLVVDLSEVTVVGGLRIDGAEEVQLLDDVSWLE